MHGVTKAAVELAALRHHHHDYDSSRGGDFVYDLEIAIMLGAFTFDCTGAGSQGGCWGINFY